MVGTSSAGTGSARRPKVGVLAVQGGFARHVAMLREAGAEAVEVRVPDDLSGLDGLVIPGGESTTITMQLESAGLRDPVRELARGGTPVLGTCAGMILLDDEHLGLLDVTARRNAFGRQLKSFEHDLELPGLEGGPFRAVFIRAPWVERAGDEVEVLAEHEGHPVAVRQGPITALAFHPELTDDLRIHRQFVASLTP